MKPTLSERLLEAAYAFDLPKVTRLVRSGARNEEAFLSDQGSTLQAGDPGTEAIFTSLRARGLKVTGEEDALFELYRALLSAGHEVPDGGTRHCVVRVVFGARKERFARAAPLMQICIDQGMLDWRTSTWANELPRGITAVLDAPHDLFASALALVARRGNLPALHTLTALLPKDVKGIHAWLQRGSSALCGAATEGQMESVRHLLTVMALPDWLGVGWGGQSPFFSACVTGQAGVAHLLMTEHGCSLQDPGMGDVLATAIGNSRRSIVPQLLKWNCDPNNVTQGEPTALHQAIWMNYHDLVELLLAAGNRVDAIDKGRMTPLMKAGMVGMESAIAPLVAAGSDLEAADAQGRTAMSFACALDRFETVQALYLAGASLDTPDLEDLTPRERAQGKTRAWVMEGKLEEVLPPSSPRSSGMRF